jgi:putative chitinase
MAQICTEARLRSFLPKLADAPAWVDALDEAMLRYDINTTSRAAAFLAQIAHESNELSRLVENLNYSPSGLMKTWPKRFPSMDRAMRYARQPEKLANFVYANRLGNSDEGSGDGWRYRGRGVLQITGRGNYRSCGVAIDQPLEAQPELLEVPHIAALAAGQFWKSRGLNELADHKNDDNDDEDFITISVLINGGKVGLADRQQYWARAKAVMVGIDVPTDLATAPQLA